MSEQPARPRPQQVGVYTKSRQLQIDWSDGHRSTYAWELLRWNCPCAVCAGEMGQPGVLQFVQKLTPEQTTLTDLLEVGQYALQPVWQDGHDTGIYSFDLLRRLCPCPECRANPPR
ncbi:MAG TPA: DUF971 domain-containing protein [Chloroflexota bacterium]|jgi:DUF971 family protein|nr:DUF971 domain-containing protein [Chloroflexota bacterium]